MIRSLTDMDLRNVRGLDIPQEVKEWCEEKVDNHKCFVSFLEYVDGEILERVFASRRYKGKGLAITEIYRDSTGVTAPVYKNLTYSKMAGYTPVFKPEDRYQYQGGWRFMVFSKDDFDQWDSPIMPMNFGRVYINTDLLKTISEFKYCGYSGGDLITYLNNYRKDNSIEMFGKMGLPLSPILINKAKNDKQFRRFLWEHDNEIAIYGIQAALYAYKHNKSIVESRRICFVKNQNDRLCAKLVPEVKGTNIDRTKLLDYLESIGDEQGNLYDDYLRAIKALKLDLNDTKNIYPKEFHRMHDLRAAEYASYMAKQDEKRRAKLYKDFAEKCKEYQVFAYTGQKYSIIIPTVVPDLVKEGNALSHCVGRMGYDKKVAEGVSLIAFVRKNEELDKPFVTVEYRFDEKKLRQCYGESDSKPAQEVIFFVDEWVKYLQEVNYERIRP